MNNWAQGRFFVFFQIFSALLVFGNFVWAESSQGQDKKNQSFNHPASVAEDTPKSEKSQSPLSTTVNMVAYRNGYVLAMRKFSLPLKQGKQTVKFENPPKTLYMSSLMPSFEGGDGAVEIISQALIEDGWRVHFDVVSTYEQTKTMYLRYMFGGLNWDVAYIAILSPDRSTLSLKGWIEVENNTSADIKHAQILFNGSNAKMSAENPSDEDSSEFSYTIPRVVDLDSGQKIFLSFLDKSSIPLKQEHVVYVGGEYLYDLKSTAQTLDVVQVVEFRNDEVHGFQHTLPQGKVTLYQGHKNGMDELVGTMRLHEKIIGQPVPLQISAEHHPSPVYCELEQTDYKKLIGTSSEAGYRVVLTNRNESPVSVRVVVNTPQESDWSVIRTSHSYDTHSKRQFSWTITVPGGQNVELKYRIKLENAK